MMTIIDETYCRTSGLELAQLALVSEWSPCMTSNALQTRRSELQRRSLATTKPPARVAELHNRTALGFAKKMRKTGSPS
jgi:hypothetical protein